MSSGEEACAWATSPASSQGRWGKASCTWWLSHDRPGNGPCEKALFCLFRHPWFWWSVGHWLLFGNCMSTSSKNNSLIG